MNVEKFLLTWKKLTSPQPYRKIVISKIQCQNIWVLSVIFFHYQSDLCFAKALQLTTSVPPFPTVGYVITVMPCPSPRGAWPYKNRPISILGCHAKFGSGTSNDVRCMDRHDSPS